MNLYLSLFDPRFGYFHFANDKSLKQLMYLLADWSVGNERYRCIIFWLIVDICNQWKKPPTTRDQIECLVRGLQSVLFKNLYNLVIVLPFGCYVFYNAHVGNSNLPDSRFLLITNDNPPTSDVPLITISIIEPNIMKVWIKSVHTTARKPP